MDLNFLNEKIQLINSKYPNINYGGCGTFSYHLSEHLEKKYNLKSEIVYIVSDAPPGLKPDYDIKFQHILIKIGEHCIDNNGYYKFTSYSQWFQIQKLNKLKLFEMINITQLWNSRFNQQHKNNLIIDIYNI